jgi:DHA1 family tetracycline resistance protein-like MFS transporter
MTHSLRPSKAAFGFILVSIVLDTLAFGVAVPVFPSLMVQLQGGDTASAANVLGLFGTAWAVMHFLAAPVWGSLSDRFGRRPVILLTLAGMGLDYVLMALAPTVAWLFVGRVISGATAGGFATASAYVADTTPPEERAKKFGLVGAAWGFGFIVGPAFGGWLAGFDLRMPFWVSAGLCLANAAYGLFILPESLPPERRTAFKWANANIVGSVALLRSAPGLLGLAAAMFFVRLGHDVNPNIAVIYSQFRFKWSEQEVGLFLAGIGVASMIVQGGLIGPAVKKLGERGALTAGMLFGAASFLIAALAQTSIVFLAGIPFGALFGLGGPAMQAIVTKKVSGSEQGQLQGALASVTAIATITAPLFFTQTFTMGMAAGFVGLPYALAAVALMVALFLGLSSTKAPS